MSAVATRASGRSQRRLVQALAAVALVAVLAGGWLWLRGSSLVSVERVSIRGVAGPDAARIRAALATAARGMTTLEVRTSTLRAAVAPYPIVAGLAVTAHPPHRLTIDVNERRPVAALAVGTDHIAAAADGTVLRDVPAAGLPAVALRSEPGGPRVTDATVRAALTLLGGAPGALLGRVASVAGDPTYGLVAVLRKGPSIRLGDASEAQAKWQAVIALLATPQNAGAAYLDVTDPHRPAAGVGPAAVAASGLAAPPTTQPGG